MMAAAVRRAAAQAAITLEGGGARALTTFAGARSRGLAVAGAAGRSVARSSVCSGSGHGWAGLGGPGEGGWKDAIQRQAGKTAMGRGTGAWRGFASDSGDKEVATPPKGKGAAKDPDDDRVVDMDRVEFPNASARVQRLADDICSLTLLEVHDMAQILRKRLDIQKPIMFVGASSAAQFMAGGGGGGGGGSGGRGTAE
mmetsp:Transcript_29569/g.47548  ORF Transcript_29569/g.47548 Transcript_29569/m.47548 type:complete len:198 (-) Transcript_29569:3-596(-)